MVSAFSSTIGCTPHFVRNGLPDSPLRATPANLSVTSFFRLIPLSSYFLKQRWDASLKSRCFACIPTTGTGLVFIFIIDYDVLRKWLSE